MIKYLLLILLIAFPFLEVGCQEIAQQNKQTNNTKKLTFTKENGILKVSEGKKSCLLADDAIDYGVYVSPNAALIAVETMLMSNLQIIRIYKKESDGCFRPLKHALSTQMWHNLSKKKGFSIEEVSHPRMKFLKWINTEQIEIELSGKVGIKIIDANVSCNLKTLY